MTLPEAFCKRQRLTPGTDVRVTDVGESLLLTPVRPPAEAELVAVIEAAGGPGPDETPKTRQQVEAARARVRARARKASSRH